MRTEVMIVWCICTCLCVCWGDIKALFICIPVPFFQGFTSQLKKITNIVTINLLSSSSYLKSFLPMYFLNPLLFFYPHSHPNQDLVNLLFIVYKSLISSLPISPQGGKKINSLYCHHNTLYLKYNQEHNSWKPSNGSTLLKG